MFLRSCIDRNAYLRLLWQNLELVIWLVALVLLYTADLDTDFTLCIPSQLGIKNCLGCGLGHSITAAMHGDFSLSWHYHYLGIFALLVLLIHVFRLLKNLVIKQ